MAERFVTRGFVGRRGTDGATGGDLASRIPPGQYLTTDFPVLSAGPTPRTPLDRWSFAIEGLVARAGQLDVGRVPCPPRPRVDRRHQLRDQVDEARHALARGQRRHACSNCGPRSERRLRDRMVRRWLHDEPAAVGHPERPGLRRLRVRRPAAAAGARRSRPPGRAGPVLLEEREMGPRTPHPGSKDEPGFWESLGYHNRGDQWLEERYSGD